MPPVSTAKRDQSRRRARADARATDRVRVRLVRRMGESVEWLTRPIIAWDGEGVTDDAGTHRYVLLAGSDGSEIVNVLGLGPDTASWLHSHLRHRDGPA